MGPVWHCDHLVGESGAGCFVFREYVIRVLSIIVRVLFLLLSLVDYVPCSRHFGYHLYYFAVAFCYTFSLYIRSVSDDVNP